MNLLKYTKEIATLLALSHKSNNKNIALSRNNEIFINPSAKSTILAWNSYPLLQYFLFQICGDGDGAKTAVFIFASLIQSYYKDKQELKLNTNFTLSKLDEFSKPATREDLKLMSKEIIDDILPELVYDFLLSNSNAHISIELGEGISYEVQHSEAFRSNTRYIGEWVEDKLVKGPMIGIFDYPISRIEDIQEYLENQIEGRPIIIIAPMFSKKVVTTINLNRNKGVLECYIVEAVKCIWQEEWLKDIASFTGATIITRHLKDFDISYLGSAKEICFKEKEMLIEQYDEHIEKTAQRIDQLIYEKTIEQQYYKMELLEERISNLQGSFIRLKIGGKTKLEATHRRALCEKLLLSLVSSVKGGVLKEGLILSLANINDEDERLDHALKCSLRIVKQNSKEIINVVPFPTLRAKQIINNAVSISHLLTSVGMIIA